MNQLAACRASGVVRRHVGALIRRLMSTVNDPYRPERYYMRGPGPKCHAKGERTSPRGEDID
jgi:hypothetical protein